MAKFVFNLLLPESQFHELDSLSSYAMEITANFDIKWPNDGGGEICDVSV